MQAIEEGDSGAGWQRCRTHYLATWPPGVAKATRPWVATLVRTISTSPTGSPPVTSVVDALADKLAEAARRRRDPPCRGADDLLAFSAFPRDWRQVWSNNPEERLNRRSAEGPTSSAPSPTAPR